MPSNPDSVKIVVQSRVGSKRLPGKALLEINGFRLIEWVLIRTIKNSHGIKVVLATTENREDDELVELAAEYGVDSVRGHETDLVTRFLEVTKIYRPQEIIRVCADNPFVSDFFIAELYEYWLESELDYAYNHAPLGGLQVMDGFGAEIFSFPVLKAIDAVTELPELREHVTAAIWNDLVPCRRGAPKVPLEFRDSHVKLDIDTLDDLERVRKIVERDGLVPDSTDQQIAKSFR